MKSAHGYTGETAWITRVTGFAIFIAFGVHAASADPLLTSWQTTRSWQYAKTREYIGGSLVQTWPATGLTDTGGGQATPAYSDVQQIRYSANFVYINSNNLASHVMGPWYNDANKTMLFGNWPSSIGTQVKIPRNPVAASTHTSLGLGDVAILVNGVVLFNALDALSYKNSTNSEVMGGDGIWNRLAYPIEGVTFDPAQCHQPQSGMYHAHGNPAGLRFQLGDNISYTTASDTYSENTSSLHHSPILGWSYDGFPIYGPYGFDIANNASSGIRRMVSGFVLRNGSNGTTNLATTGRTTLPAWAAAAHTPFTTTLTAAQYGPAISPQRSLGRYAEDYDHLGDHGVTQGTTYDLDKYNGRTCVTPEFPGGTYAYFFTIDGTGVPQYPNVIGGQYYGQTTGGHAMIIGEPTTSFYLNTGTSAVQDWGKY